MLVAVAYLAAALLGFAAWRKLPLELLPDTELPRLGVQALWPGASPQTTEAQLTAPLEATVPREGPAAWTMATSRSGEGGFRSGAGGGATQRKRIMVPPALLCSILHEGWYPKTNAHSPGGRSSRRSLCGCLGIVQSRCAAGGKPTG